MHLRRLALTLAPMLLTGCMVGPKYKIPTPPTAPDFKEAANTDPNWQPAQPAAEIPKGAWWTVFQDDGLNALEPQVEAANQTLKAADANLRAARAAIGIESSRKFPTLGISPSLVGERYSAQRPFFNHLNTNNGESDIQLPLQLSYEVDLWGRVRRGITEATEESQAAAADRQTALLALQAEVALDYFELRASDAQQKLFNDTVAQYQEAVRVTNNRFTGGVSPKSDLTQAQTQLAAARVAAADVAIHRAQYEHAIANLIGKAPANFTLAANPLPLNVTPPNIPPGLPAQLLERRPDIASEERLTAAANERIGIARSAFFPTLSLTGAAGFETTSFSTLLTPSNFVYAVGPALAHERAAL
ncbi:MAG: efflux transporter outer membrane subunit [Acidobacteriota bacterium]